MSSALYEYAKKELERIEKGCEDEESLSMQQAIDKNILELINVFSNQHHSGFTAAYVIDILQRLLNYKPLTPLTGEDDEWEDVTSYGYDTPTFQNKRCSAVFKDDKGAYWIEGKIFSSDLGHTWYTNSDSCVSVTFPFNVPDKSEVVIIDNKEQRLQLLHDIKKFLQYDFNVENINDINEDTALSDLIDVDSDELDKFKNIIKSCYNFENGIKLYKDDKIWNVINSIMNEQENMEELKSE